MPTIEANARRLSSRTPSDSSWFHFAFGFSKSSNGRSHIDGSQNIYVFLQLVIFVWWISLHQQGRESDRNTARDVSIWPSTIIPGDPVSVSSWVGYQQIRRHFFIRPLSKTSIHQRNSTFHFYSTRNLIAVVYVGRTWCSSAGCCSLFLLASWWCTFIIGDHKQHIYLRHFLGTRRIYDVVGGRLGLRIVLFWY